MSGLLPVPCHELQKALEKDRKKASKKRADQNVERGLSCDSGGEA